MSRCKNQSSPPISKRLRTRSLNNKAGSSRILPKTPTSSNWASGLTSPAAELELVDKLEHIKEKLRLDDNNLEVERLILSENLKVEDLAKISQSAKDYILLRDKLRSEVPDQMQYDSKTGLNLGAAVIAGAKVMVDESCTTRSMSKKIAEQCGIKEHDFLYKGLKGEHRESKCAMDIAKVRKSAVIESLVDFQKQISFKEKVLKHIARKTCDRKSKSDSRVNSTRRLRSLRNFSNFVLHTPRRLVDQKEINPLDDEKIMDSYALRIAIEAASVSRRRSIGTIPFNRAMLDEID